MKKILAAAALILSLSACSSIGVETAEVRPTCNQETASSCVELQTLNERLW